VVDRPVALFAMQKRYLPTIITADVRDRLARLVDLDDELVAERFDDPAITARLADTEILITGWGCPPIDDAVLQAAPRLRAVVHTAGSVKGHLTPECWTRGLLVSSAADANAIPVAELTVAMILLTGKDVFGLRDRYRHDRTFEPGEIVPGIGNYHRRVGIVGASRIGRRVMRLLAPFDLTVSLTDPYVPSAPPNVRLLALADLLRDSDVVSLHAPAIPETHHLMNAQTLALIPDGGVLINTARGSLVDTDALVAELATGRISAVLDVTDPEPLPASSPLFELPNVFLTPHIAGSQGNELGRLGHAAADELERVVAGVPLAHQILAADLDRVA
jgi:phosphoglycerate dehydrogenase-like enzyme